MNEVQGRYGGDVAVIGMAGRFPGAADVGAFWHNLREGVESVTFFEDEVLRKAGVPEEVLADPSYIKAAPVLTGYEDFDAHFFGYHAREAALIDPQQRLFLECAWEAVEDAGYPPGSVPGVVGVYASAALSTYLIHHLLAGRTVATGPDTLELLLTNDKDYLANRVAYKLGLRGPAVAVQSACSSSLVATHLATQALLDGECDLALAGGVAVRLPQPSGYRWQDGLVFSADGHTRSFDADASGTVFGSGCGVVLLKRYEDAVADGDRILAVVKGSAVTNDGAAKIGYTAPGVDGQAQAIATALGLAGVEPRTVTAIEAHGTATPLGDPIEVAALTRVFAARTRDTGFCALGTVKSNVGHLDTAAGVAGLIKAIQQLRHRELAPSLHYRRPNPQIDFPGTPFHVNAELRAWDPGDHPRRIGVSSFGMGGTNAHVVLEEAPQPAARPAAPAGPVLIVVSAHSRAALDAGTERLALALRAPQAPDLADVAYTLHVGRQALPYRRTVVAATAEQAAARLSGQAPGAAGALAGERPRVVFMFPGQGSQYPGMGQELYAGEEVFRQTVDRCAVALTGPLGCDLRTVLYPAPGTDAVQAAARLSRTEFTQPALFVVEYALVRLLDSWGIRPDAMVGHSVGEIVAATLAGVLDLDGALRLVAARGRLMGQLPTGAMLTVGLPAEELVPLLPADLDLAAVNAAELCVVAGDHDGVARFEQVLTGRGVQCRRLHTSHAFHSAMMDPAMAGLRAELAGIGLAAPRVPYAANVTGTLAQADQVTDPEYWVRHARETVRFADGLAAVTALPGAAATAAGPAGTVLVELGPGQVLTMLAGQAPGRTTVTTMPRPGDGQSGRTVLLGALGRLWAAGVGVDVTALHGDRTPARVALPTYPFQRRRYWIEPAADAAGASAGLDGIVIAPAGPGDDGTDAGSNRPPISSDYVAPRDDRERLIAAIWQDLLGITPVGVHDNFIELGGHSLLATRVVARVRAAFGVPLVIRQMLTAPTVADLADLVRTMSPAGTAMATSAAGADGQPALPDPAGELPVAVADPAGRFEPFPLAEIQQAQWLGRLGTFEGGNVAAHVYWEVEAAELDLDRLADTWNQILDRHLMLRAVVHPDGTQQVLADSGRYHLPVLDLRDRDSLAAAAQLAALREELTTTMRPADRWPLFDVRATLLPGRTRLHLGFELLIADIGSIRLISRDWRRLYQGRALAPLELTYRDYVLALDKVRLTQGYQRARDYWRDRIAALPPRPELPLALAPASVTRPEPVSFDLALADAAWRRITERSGGLGLTPSSLLLAAFAIAVGRWSRNAAFTLNVTVINRLPVHEQISDIVGEFASFDLLPADLSATADLVSLARALQEQSWSDLEHRQFSGVEVLREMARGRGAAAGAVAPIVFTSTIVQSSEPGDETWFGWIGEVVHEISQTPQVWLDFALLETPNGVRASWHAVRQIFPEGVLDAMFDGFRSLVLGLVEGHGWSEPVDVAPAALADMVAEVNRTDGPVPEGLLIDGAGQWAAREPDRVAVVSAGEGASMTYGQLWQRAGALAAALIDRGVVPGELVAVAAAKSLAQVVAAYAVQRSGAGYLPVDPALPAQRRGYLLAAGRCRYVLTGAADAPVSWPDGVEVLVVEEFVAAAADGDTAPAQCPAGPDDVAYVIFTSGSTGEPKGVTMTHRASLNTCVDITARFGIGPRDAVLGLSSLSFDLSVYDVFGVLAAGGRLVLPRPGSGRDPQHWLELVRDHGVTLWNSVPALADMAVTHATGHRELAGALSPIRLALWSGDWIALDLPQRWRDAAPQCRTISLGGATEAAIWSIWHDIGTVDETWESVPYGRPLTNQQFHVLNDRYQDCPLWVVGELYIGGVGLAQGYWGDPERTAAQFITHPVTGRRLYRTGDLGRWRPGGVIEFLGRDDFQVKVGGYRIELGEIDAALGRDGRVATAVTVAVGDRHHRRLVAFVVPRSDPDDPADLAGRLLALTAEVLPAYMVPGSVVVTDRLPLTANGKVDRAALAVTASAAAAGTGSVSPESGGPVAVALAGIIGDVLGVTAVGLTDNLFALGGDSIAGIQVVNRATAAGLEITPADLFTQPTIGALAQVVAARGGVGRTGELPLTGYQAALLERGGPATAGVLRGLLPLPDTAADQVAADRVARAVARVLGRLPALRLRLVDADGTWSQRLADAAEVDTAVATVDLAPLPPARRQAALDQMLDELAGELDPVAGPVAKATVFDLGDGQRRLALTLSAAVVDAASWPILLRELARELVPDTVAATVDPLAVLGLPAELAGSTGTEAALLGALRASGDPAGVPVGDGASRPAGPRLLRQVRRDPHGTTRLLDAAARAYRLRPPELVAAAVALALHGTGDGLAAAGALAVERDVRGDTTVDLTAVAGPLAVLGTLPVPATADLAELVTVVKDRYRQPQSGAVPAAVLVRHLGELPWPGPTPAEIPWAATSFPVTVGSAQIAGELVVTVLYPADQPGAQALADGLDPALDRLLEHFETSTGPAVSATDFPLSGLDAGALSSFLAAITTGRGSTPAPSTPAAAAAEE